MNWGEGCEGGGGRDLPRRIKGLWFLGRPLAGGGSACTGSEWGHWAKYNLRTATAPSPVTLEWLCQLGGVVDLLPWGQLSLPPPPWTRDCFFMGPAQPLGATQVPPERLCTPELWGGAGPPSSLAWADPLRTQNLGAGLLAPPPFLKHFFTWLLHNLFLLLPSCLLDSSFSAFFSPSP